MSFPSFQLPLLGLALPTPKAPLIVAPTVNLLRTPSRPPPDVSMALPPLPDVPSASVQAPPSAAQRFPPTAEVPEGEDPEDGTVPDQVEIEPPQGLSHVVMLRKHQTSHVQRVLGIWKNHFFAIDPSIMGSGKTHSSSYLAQVCNFPFVVVVCPASVEHVWKVVRDKYRLPIVVITSYESLRSVKGSQPKHGLLTRTDHAVSGASFAPTQAFKDMAENGCLLIADEFQRIKNKNDQYYAFKAMSEYIHERRGRSRCLLLSGTPFDKQEQVVNMLQMIGIIRNHRLFVYHKDEVRLELLGAQELVDYCNMISRENTEDVLNRMPFTHKNIREVCYELYIKVIQQGVVSAMPQPDIAVDILCFNGYFNMSPEGSDELKRGISLLDKASRYNADSATVNTREADWAAITGAIRTIQTAKVEIFVREAIKVLDSNPQAKVVLYFDFNEPIDKAAVALAAYNPMIITGKINKLKRPQLIKKFQENNTQCRLAIFNLAVGCEGIDLDDTDGTYPRYAFASPNYYVMRMHQMTRRFYRANTRSEATICFVYGKCGREETSIINALCRKTTVMKDTLKNQVDTGIVFPAEYPSIISSDDDEEAGSRPANVMPPPSIIVEAPSVPRSRGPSPNRGVRLENIVLAPSLSANRLF